MKEKVSHRMPRSARLPKVKTINDLLTRDDINGMLADLDKEKPNISDLIVIYLNKDTKKYNFQITEDTLNTTAVWLLQQANQDVLNDDTEEE